MSADVVKGFYVAGNPNPGFTVVGGDEVYAAVYIGKYDIRYGGGVGEFKYIFGLLRGKPYRRLCIFDDGIAVFAEMPELLTYLTELGTKDVSVGEFTEGLKRLGYQNIA